MPQPNQSNVMNPGPSLVRVSHVPKNNAGEMNAPSNVENQIPMSKSNPSGRAASQAQPSFMQMLAASSPMPLTPMSQ